MIIAAEIRAAKAATRAAYEAAKAAYEASVATGAVYTATLAAARRAATADSDDAGIAASLLRADAEAQAALAGAANVAALDAYLAYRAAADREADLVRRACRA